MLYLFDIDGTILLTGGAGKRALDWVFAQRHGVQGAMNSIRAGGKTDPYIITEIFLAHLRREPTAAEIEEVLDAYIPRLRHELSTDAGFRLMPHVVEILSYLETRPEVSLALATGNVRAGAEAKLAHCDLWSRFPVGGFGCDAPVRAALVARAIERATAHTGRRFARREIVVVGDTPHDVSAARACGVRVVAVATGATSRAELERTGADLVLDTLAELPAWHEEQLAHAS
jgi:phosphoglycolate phosphatase-like HAD superfamily hydrolase